MEQVNQNIRVSELLRLTNKQWRDILASEVDVYVYGNGYLAKRFDSIAFEFCNQGEAKEILKDNLYCLLKYEYFTYQDNKLDKVITNIINSFTENLKTTLLKIVFEDSFNDSYKVIKPLPPSAIAFRNGVYDFDTNKFLFRVYRKKLEAIQNNIFYYDRGYAILWYLDIDFDPLPLDIKKIDQSKLVSFFKDNKEYKNLAFNLIYNMSFSEDNRYSKTKFQHLSEILGFTLNSQFIQNFIIFIGTGSNGKNSLFDGAFTSHLLPKPVSISLDSIEEDKFVTGALENRYHNFFLETSNKTYHKSEMLKQLTGSPQQSIEKKGENRRTGYINIKHIFSGNDKEKLRFGDSTVGFTRRINLYEVFYQWDSKNDYLKLGDYLETNISPDLKEIKLDKMNVMAYVYIGMWGMYQSTKGFTSPLVFTYNDYSVKYENINPKIKETFGSFLVSDLVKIILKEGMDHILYVDGYRIYTHPKFYQFFKVKKSDWKLCLNDENEFIEFLEDKEVWINLNLLRLHTLPDLSQTKFNQEITKWTKSPLKSYYNSQKYTKIGTIGYRINFKKLKEKSNE